ncbi:MAG: hypothetical protein D6767_00780 [Candidatus Hydrogenedentota bacterium]|nr:MAG: hypothetical protein D6767_00780 [Candidatus Hydrogenedentota bacterium]
MKVAKTGILSLLALLVGISGFPQVQAKKKSKETLAVALLVIGKVDVLRNGRKKRVKTKMFFEKNDTIITSRNGKINLQIGPKAVIRVAPNSMVQLSKLAEIKRGEQIELTLKKGTIYSKIVRKLKGNEAFRVRTRTIVAAVRGTEFAFSNLNMDQDKIKDEENLSSGVYVNEGKVKVETNSGEKVDVSAGEEVRLTGAKLKKQILEAFVKRKLEIFKNLDVMKEQNYKMLKAQKERGQKALQKIFERNKQLREKMNK